MNKNQIEQISIKKQIDFKTVLSLSLSMNGHIQRQGNGELPAQKMVLKGIPDPTIFSNLISSLDERIFYLSDVYDSPDKPGKLAVYTIRFSGKKPLQVHFEFHVGTESENVGELLPYLQAFISRALALTDDWYTAGTLDCLQNQVAENATVVSKPWYRFW